MDESWIAWTSIHQHKLVDGAAWRCSAASADGDSRPGSNTSGQPADGRRSTIPKRPAGSFDNGPPDSAAALHSANHAVIYSTDRAATARGGNE